MYHIYVSINHIYATISISYQVLLSYLIELLINALNVVHHVTYLLYTRISYIYNIYLSIFQK